jgi:hypothetical protein
MSSGSWYCEFTSSSGQGSGFDQMIGLSNSTIPLSGNHLGAFAGGYGYYPNGNKYNNNSGSSYGSSWGAGDVIGIAFDATNGSLYFYKNGTVQNGGTAAFTGLTSGPYFFTASMQGTSSAGVWNFGQRAFAYPVSGYKALVDTNLPTPLVAKPNTVMDVALYTGNGAARNITGLAFNPDLVWIKGRSQAYGHRLLDVVRGATNALASSSTAAEFVESTGLTAFNSDGFSLGAAASYNDTATTYVGWAWDAGTSTVTNTAGSISSQVRANASAGFSVVTYTGNGSNGATVGHGLGVAPDLVLFKRRDSVAQDWGVYHVSGGRKNLQLNTTGAYLGGGATYWDAVPTSTVIYPDNVYVADHYQNVNSATYVAYCFSSVVGYSSMGSYVGNGSSDGSFVYTGHKARLLMIKRTDSTGNWIMHDTARDTYNVADKYLLANSSGAEISGTGILDILSNGFKARNTWVDLNASGGTYVFASFAENPFQYARAR